MHFYLLFLSLGLILTAFSPELEASDKYRNFNHLKASEKLNSDYRINTVTTDSKVLVMAIHGGQIEGGTCQLAKAVAKKGDFNLYSFEGIKSKNNWDLHVSSTRFNEPRALKMVGKSSKTLSLHGCVGKNKITYMGGLDSVLGKKIEKNLKAAGFIVRKAPSHLNGKIIHNITNENKINKGVQLEITKGLRGSFIKDKVVLDRYATALTKALNE